MSRCYCCQAILKTSEACAKFKTSGDYTEMCNKCIKETDLQDIVQQADSFEDNELDIEDSFNEQDDRIFDDEDEED